jgi:hypothetical protein
MVLNMAAVITEGLAAKRDVKCTGGLVLPLTLCQVSKKEYLQINVRYVMLALNSGHYDWKANYQLPFVQVVLNCCQKECYLV